MKVLIFEGIATSGKSSVIKVIKKSLASKMNVLVAGEDQTHEPIMNQRNNLHLPFFMDLIDKLSAKNPDLLIFDRLYITQAFRARSDLSQYSQLEDALLPHSSLTILLTVAEEEIADRIKKSSMQRGKEWQDFWKTKGDTYEEIADGYIKQQESLLALAKQSKIPYLTFDTTHHSYEDVAAKILETLQK